MCLFHPKLAPALPAVPIGFEILNLEFAISRRSTRSAKQKICHPHAPVRELVLPSWYDLGKGTR